jgi:nucleoside-diphosphate-sugar epimerase
MHILSGKNILVTGGAGFVGSHLAEKLLSLNARVFVFDNNLKQDGYFKTAGLAKKLECLDADLRNLEQVNFAVEKNQSTHATGPDRLSRP